MPWIPHLMVLDDDPRVLESLMPSFANDLAKALGQSPTASAMLRRGDLSGARPGAPIHLKVTAHGFTTDRVKDFRWRTPFHAHLHLVRETGGKFDLARNLLNKHLFAVVVSDLRFSDDAGGLRAGQLFVDEMSRVHPDVQGLLYSAYPKPEGFPADRFLRKGASAAGEPALSEMVVKAFERHLAIPSIQAYAAAIADQGLIYQSDSFGSMLAQLYDFARLLGPAPTSLPINVSANMSSARSRRALPCLLVDGESGTGKRGIAEVFHAAADRRKAPLQLASCAVLSSETLLRSTLFGHKRGAFTDAREDRLGLVASADKGVLLLDDFHRLPTACSAILHSFLEDGEYSRLGEEEVRRHAESAVVITVETEPWKERKQSGELPPAFLARVERLALRVPPLRERPEDIEAQARWLVKVVSAEVRADLDIDDEAIERLRICSFADSNSRELRNVIEQAVLRHHRETDFLAWDHLAPYIDEDENVKKTSTPIRNVPAASLVKPDVSVTPSPVLATNPLSTPVSVPVSVPAPVLNEWQQRLRLLASKILVKGTKLESDQAKQIVQTLFDQELPRLWAGLEQARTPQSLDKPIPMPVWEDMWRCFAVSWLGGPTPAEKSLGIPANTLRQWINDRESK